MLIDDGLLQAKDQSARLRLIAAIPQIERVLVQPVPGEVVAHIATDHVARDDGRPGAVAADGRACRVARRQRRFGGRVGHHAHGDRLIAAQDVVAVNVGGEQVKPVGVKRVGPDLNVHHS